MSTAEWTGPTVLDVSRLRTVYPASGEPLHAVRDVSLQIRAGEIVGLVGESGSGKSTVLKSVLGLIRPPGRVSAERLALDGRELAEMSAAELRRIRGGQISMIFQDPINSFNPAWSIGDQFKRVLRLHRPDLSPRQHEDEILRLLRAVGIDGRGKLSAYPFQFSQGQLQRIMIAVACASRDLKVLLADEPTTSLDVTIEAQVLELLRELRRQRGLALVLVTHDLSVVAELCDRVMVMYAGQIVEEASVDGLFATPQHPYTQQLLRSIPAFPHDGKRLYTMRGGVPKLTGEPVGCPFAPRCDSHLGRVCDDSPPRLLPVADGGRQVACHRHPAQSTEEAISR
ncbi:ABC transporter ATP-binding protein [Dactylosporangium sucinum]|uniref:Dipeptide ABC transporter ATP-binding protein n=1 Tax=Dactylosporangium sucinum TaxID=1424081 RepID=A0A917TZ98_9ACTN|nr:ABC transporter ATP-binding protein [Dactylosporangium sucinum]GGM45802.1 dipeptide ABC transporter ATP-binding protein [Dactylosporangium sucinum]